MIRSLKTTMTEAVFHGAQPKRFPHQLFERARNKLLVLDAAAGLDDLRTPPSNHLEALHRDRAGQHSIRLDDQWRVCFRWTDAGPEDVEITDDH